MRSYELPDGGVLEQYRRDSQPAATSPTRIGSKALVMLAVLTALGATAPAACSTNQGVIVEGVVEVDAAANHGIVAPGTPAIGSPDGPERIAANSRLGRELLADPGVSTAVKAELSPCSDWYPISVGYIYLSPDEPRPTPETTLIILNVSPCPARHLSDTGFTISVNLAGYVYRSIGTAGSATTLGERVFSIEEQGKYIVNAQRRIGLSVLETDPRPSDFDCCPRPPIRTEFTWTGAEFMAQ